MTTSVDFNLSTDETVVFAASDPLSKKVTTIVVSNERDDTSLDYTITWSVGPQVLYSGTVQQEEAVPLINGVYFMQEAGVEMTASASGNGLTLHLVYEDLS
jgi:hypothetical protein